MPQKPVERLLSTFKEEIKNQETKEKERELSRQIKELTRQIENGTI